jgi:cobalt transporter subunit CbtB
MTTKTTVAARDTTDLLAITATVFLGLALIFAAGFSNAQMMHDAAHDQRHTIAFPCH